MADLDYAVSCLKKFDKPFTIATITAALKEEENLKNANIEQLIASLLQFKIIVKLPYKSLFYTLAEEYREEVVAKESISNYDYTKPYIAKTMDIHEFREFLKVAGQLKRVSSCEIEFNLESLSKTDQSSCSLVKQIRCIDIDSKDAILIIDSTSTLKQKFSDNVVNTNDLYFLGYPIYRVAKKNYDDSDEEKEDQNKLIPVFYFVVKQKSGNAYVKKYGPFLNKKFLEQIKKDHSSKKDFNFAEAEENINFLMTKDLTFFNLLTETFQNYSKYLSSLFSSLFSDLDESLDSDWKIGKICNAATLAPYTSNLIKYTQKITQELEVLADPKLTSDDQLRNSALSLFFKDSIDDKTVSNAYDAELFRDNKEKSTLIFDLGTGFKPDLGQDKAIRSILKNKLTVLKGPPGTGKTSTIVAALYNSLVRNERSLLTSYNEAAIEAFYEKAKVVKKNQTFSFAKNLTFNQNGKGSLSFEDLLKSLSNRRDDMFEKSYHTHEDVISSKEDFKKETLIAENKLMQLHQLIAIYSKDLNEKISLLEQKLDALFTELPKFATKSKTFKDLKNYLFSYKNIKYSGSQLNKLKRTDAYYIPDNIKAIKSVLKKLNIIVDNIYKYKRNSSKYYQSRFNYYCCEFISTLNKGIPIIKRTKLYSHLDIEKLLVIITDYKVILKTLQTILDLKKELHLSDPESINLDLDEINSNINEVNTANCIETNSLIQYFKDFLNEDDAPVAVQDKVTLNHIKSLKGQYSKHQQCSVIFDYFPVVTQKCLSVPSSIPFQNGFFDLVVFDEAAQYDFLSALPIIYRAKRIAIIGDPEQLKPINQVSSDTVKQIISQNCDGDYLSKFQNVLFNATLFDFARQSNCAKIFDSSTNLWLVNNRRSNATIVNYISKYFYSSKLVAAREEKTTQPLLCGKYQKGISFIDVVDDVQAKNGSKKSQASINKIAELLKDIKADKNYKNSSIGIITPFSWQKDELTSMLISLNLKDNVSVGTIHSFQGQERDIIIISTCIGIKISTFFKKNLINVAVSRGKDYVFIVNNLACIRSLTNQYDYIRDLSNFIDPNYKTEEPVNIDAFLMASADSNREKLETIYEQRLYDKLKYHLDRDEELSSVPKIYTQLEMSNYRLDLALVKGNRGIDIECDGSQHYIYWLNEDDYELIPYDKTRAAVLKKAVISFETIRFSNRQIASNPDDCVKKIIALYKRMFLND